MSFKFNHDTAGYCDCACRDCFDTAISSVGNTIGTVLCWACKRFGCEPQTQECQRPDAYGVDNETDLEENSNGQSG